ncbi:unnamed protein product [Caenorhabditis auriculariae]|uniref:Uncharacterized protein n=1 Tax=Caenorhabditis auriculariae TaxID=2777116 RepID=A0A8S1HF22_9PELO|nr:unnamed protein product [Caenorhabditis auriculariae]
MIRAIFFATAFIGAAADLVQRLNMTGKLMCFSKPAWASWILLIDNDVFIDEVIDNTVADAIGRFKLSGWASDPDGSIEPALIVQHSCGIHGEEYDISAPYTTIVRLPLTLFDGTTQNITIDLDQHRRRYRTTFESLCSSLNSMRINISKVFDRQMRQLFGAKDM